MGAAAALAAPTGWAAAGALGDAAVAAGVFLVTNPIGWAILGTVAVVGVVALANAHQQSKEQTKDEAQDQVCSTCKPKNPCDHLKRGNGPGDYRGGGHGNPQDGTGTSSPTGDGLDSHHMPAKQSYSGSGLDPADGPAIQMEPGDHQMTHTYGGRGNAARSAQSEMIENGQFEQAFEQSAEDAREIARQQGDPGRYDQAIKESKAYLDCLKAHGLLPGQGGS